MNYSFPIFSPSQSVSSQPQPEKLKQLVQGLGIYSEFSEILNLPLVEGDVGRSLEEIMADLESGQISTISSLEWIYIMIHKNDWDQAVSTNRAENTSKLLWKVAEKNGSLLSHLVWMLGMSYSTPNLLADSIIETVDFAKLQTLISLDTVRILKWLSEFNYVRIAQEACSRKMLPESLLESVKVPVTQKAVTAIFNNVVKGFQQSNLNESQAGRWLCQCLESMPDSLELQQVNQLLLEVSHTVGNSQPYLVEWLRQRYWHRSPGSRWNQLSRETQNSLRMWIHAASWQDFKNLVNAISKQLNQEISNYQENSHQFRKIKKEINQLKRRQEFWSNYSTRFERLRVLVPANSQKFISDEIKRDIDVLVEDNSDPTEVCIFDFGDKYIIEFFRGRGSEIRFLSGQLNPRVEDYLFANKNLSICSLRKLGGEIHDHAYVWQAYAEKWLRERKILPNEGIRHWQGLNRSYGQYHPQRGLPMPNLEKANQHEEQVQKWMRTMRRIESDCES